MLSYEVQVSAEARAWQHELQFTLDHALRKFSKDPSPSTIDAMAIRLGDIFDIASAQGEVAVFKAICKAHLMDKYVLEDPHARRAREKPRGYAGDAVMLDYIYRPQAISGSAAALAMHRATIGLPSSSSILWRRDYLARQITAVVKRTKPARVLAVASGHMRELDVVEVPEKRDDLEVCAVDLDSLSLEECVRSYPDINIRAVRSSAVTIRRARLPETFHLVYSAGLFDYLNDATAEFVLGQLYRQLLPSGLLCIANFTPEHHARGFMEGFMDWSLILRDEADLVRIAKSAVPGCALSAFRDPHGNIAYLEIRRH
jgi:hypothetical protein